jgi:hypothetical protein
VKTVLLALGALLLVVAAVIFMVVAWGRMGAGGRTLCMGLATVAAAAGAHLAARRRLRATAEAVAALTVALLLLDAFGLRRLGVAGLDGVSWQTYWAVATGLVAALCAASGVLHRLRTTRLAAIVLGQAPGWLIASTLEPVPAAALLVAQSAWLVALAAAPAVVRPAAVARRVSEGVRVPLDVRLAAMAGLLPTWLTAAATAYLTALDGADGTVLTATAVLLGAGLVAAAVAATVDDVLPREAAGGGGNVDPAGEPRGRGGSWARRGARRGRVRAGRGCGHRRLARASGGPPDRHRHDRRHARPAHRAAQPAARPRSARRTARAPARATVGHHRAGLGG